jgi:hypothetical protein
MDIEDKELFNKMLGNRNFKDELTKKQDEWERANKIFPDTRPLAFGVITVFICFIIFIPFETSTQFKQIYSTILGIIGGIIQNYRLNKHYDERELRFKYIREDLMFKYENDKQD